MSIETTLPQTNGHPPEPAASPWEEQAHEHAARLEAQAIELRLMLSAERTLAMRVQAELDEVKERERRIERAIAMLAGEKLGAAGKVTGKPAQSPQTPKNRPKGGYVSEAMIERVYDTLAELGQARMSEIRKASGASDPSVRRSLEMLRERERIRIIAHDKRLGATYALMPEVTDAA